MSLLGASLPFRHYSSDFGKAAHTQPLTGEGHLWLPQSSVSARQPWLMVLPITPVSRLTQLSLCEQILPQQQGLQEELRRPCTLYSRRQDLNPNVERVNPDTPILCHPFPQWFSKTRWEWIIFCSYHFIFSINTTLAASYSTLLP